MTTKLESALARVVASLPGSEAREGQVQMALAVERALSDERHLAVRAGTGTGKSLAYLVPAVLSNKRVVVATATKALQDQLGEKDLPLIQAALGRSAGRFSLLKGRSNYLCRQRLAESVAAGAQGELELDPLVASEHAAADDQVDAATVATPRSVSMASAEVAELLEWAATTTTGDRAELASEVHPKVWSAFSVTAEECPGAQRCPSGGECFAEAARQRASEASLVVVNLHLLGSDLASGGAVLPEHDALVVDEAHALEDVLSDTLGRSIGAGRLRALAGLARPALSERRGQGRGEERTTDDLVRGADRLESLLAARDGERLRSGPDGELGELLALLASRVERIEGQLRQAEPSRAEPGQGDQKSQRAALFASRLREDLASLAALGDEDVAWIEGGARPRLVVAPIDVAPHLAEHVFSQMSVVLTSATLAPRLALRLGADAKRTDELDVGSPFAYDEHALLYCAAHLPDRRSAKAEEAIHKELAALIEAAQGRTLALFTSRAAMERAAGALTKASRYPILVQGSASKGALLSRFTSEHGACLFATMGFWQGVDVPGATLSCVVIDRIPFPRPDDPLLSARRERAGRGAFGEIDLPRAATMLAQGAGRLIRNAEDRGVVAVLDSRLAHATYRWDLVRALPPMRRTRHREEAEAFLARLAEPGRDASSTTRSGGDQ